MNNYGPRIVTDGLILHYDAAFRKSYPREGSILYDLSDTKDNASINGPVFSDTNNGVFEFDGVNDVFAVAGNSSSFFPLPTFSIEVVFRCFGTVPTTGSNPRLFGFTYGIRGAVGTTYLQFGCSDGVNGLTYVYTEDDHNYRDGSWYHVVYINYGDGLAIYVNGIFKNYASITWNGTSGWPTNGFNIGRDNNNSNYFLWGQIPIFKLYNKALSAEEIKQNFNAIRGRYDL